MIREVQSILLLLVGGAVVRISVGDVYLRYVKESLQPFLIFAGSVLVLLGAAGVLAELRAEPSGARAAPEPDEPAAGPVPADGSAAAVVRAAASADGHAAGHQPADGHLHASGPRIAWLLVLPVLAIFLVAPPALGSYAAARDSATVAPPAESEFPPLPPGDPTPVRVADYAVRAVWDGGRSLHGRTVTMSGFATPREGGGWYLTRMSLSCCAADALATKVEVREAPAPPTDSWVALTGSWLPSERMESEDGVPVVRALDVRAVDPPHDPYE